MTATTSDFFGTDRFRIRRRLGSGGMGVVYEAHDRETDKVLALKALTRTEAGDIYRFKREFRALADVSHPNLVSLYEFMSDGTFWFFTMELVRGVTFLEYVRPGFHTRRHPASGTATLLRTTEDPSTGTDHEAPTVELEIEVLRLDTDDSISQRRRDRLPDHSRLDLQRLRPALRQLSEGLHGLHETGKLHRDIKPSNVLVTREGRVVILDFGLVAEVEAKGVHDSEILAGTPDYMSPEQGAQLPLSKASDWYSVGVILYQALTGRLPFTGKYFEVIMDKQSLDPPAPIDFVPDLPRDLNDLCMKLLRRKPEKRPSGRDVLRFLGHGKTGRLQPALALRPAAVSEVSLPFVGRERHFSELREAFEATQRGRTVTVYIHGGSGMGKSALVQRFVEKLRDENENTVVLEGRCYERESVPYKALDGVVDSLNRYLRSLPEAKAAALMPREAYALARLFPVMLQVDSIYDSPLRDQEILDPLTLRRRAFAALRELFARISDRQPLVLWIDDLQWADADSAALLEELLRPPDAPPLLLLTGFRTEDVATKPFLQSLLRQAGSEACRELRVEELESSRLQPVDEMDEGHLRGVALARKHALPEECGAERHAVEPADELAAAPCFDGVARAEGEQIAIELADAGVDPRFRPFGDSRGARVDDRAEVAIDADLEAAGGGGARQAARDVEIIKGNDAALLGLDPVEAGIVGGFGHREDAHRIRFQQNLRRDLEEDVVAGGHGKVRRRYLRRCGRSPARVTPTSRCTAALDGKLLAAESAWRQ